MNSSQSPTAPLMEHVAKVSSAVRVLEFLQPVLEWILVLVLIGGLLALAGTFIAALITVVLESSGWLGKHRARKAADVELARYADGEDSATLCGTPGASIHGI